MEHETSAREKALAAAAEAPRKPSPPPVAFESGGRVLVLGSGERVVRAARELAASLECHWITDRMPPTAPEGVVAHDARGRTPTADGHLGAFRVLLGGVDLGTAVDPERPVFDLILDLSTLCGGSPIFEREWSPPGCFRPRDEGALAAALSELPGLRGRVEKPKFFHFDVGACAHGRPGTEGCRRCLEACPADAIASFDGRIGIDANLCQGGGACATTCPTGAIGYARPDRADTLESLRLLIGTWCREVPDARPVLVLHAGDAPAFERDGWPARALPWKLEEIASAGMETWLAAACLGASAVRLLRTPDVAPRIERVLDEQLSIVQAVLEGLGLPAGAIGWVAPGDDPWAGPELPSLPRLERLPTGSKREALAAALDHLVSAAAARSEGVPKIVAVPDGAPFGTLRVDGRACTTCFSCVFVCPTRALASGGGDVPQLLFTEGRCVQCGLCAAACPEDAIRREPRLVTDAGERRRRVLLHEDEPFPCARCGRVFSSVSTIRVVKERLADHPMFAGEGGRILECCDDCRPRAF